jgi:hypothetical protein
MDASFLISRWSNVPGDTGFHPKYIVKTLTWEADRNMLSILNTRSIEKRRSIFSVYDFEMVVLLTFLDMVTERHPHINIDWSDLRVYIEEVHRFSLNQHTEVSIPTHPKIYSNFYAGAQLYKELNDINVINRWKTITVALDESRPIPTGLLYYFWYSEKPVITQKRNMPVDLWNEQNKRKT